MELVPINSRPELESAARGDGLLYWVAQGFRPGVLAWRMGEATGVACADLSRRDRLAVAGPAADVVELVACVLSRLDPSFRQIGDAALIRTLCDRLPELTFVAEFVWMETSEPPALPADRSFTVRWLGDGELPAVAMLLEAAHPRSDAHPRRAGIRRWAGAELAGRLVAVAADAWSTPGLGYIAGVATAPEYRGRGAATAVTAFVAMALVREEGRVALMVDADNVPAIAAYRRIGFTSRRVAAARRRGGTR